MTKESAHPKSPKSKAPAQPADKSPPTVPDADLEYEDTTHDDDNVQQSGHSDASVPPDTR
jgi:hypothetical protein